MSNSESLPVAALEAALKLTAERGSFEDFKPLKPPKRGGSRESIPTAANALRRGFMDQVAATDESLRRGWRYGCYLFNNNCYICGKPFLEGEVPQADHVVPPVAGGSTNAGNMLPAHSVCNDLKGDQLPEEFFADNETVLLLIKHYQEKFNFKPDPSLYPLANEKVSSYIEMMKKDILHTRNLRELSQDDSGLDSVETQQLTTSPLVSHLMRAVMYYLQANDFAPTARSKMMGYTRRILHSWNSVNPELDLFTENESTVRKFIHSFFLTLTDHPDSFNRAHRAFRILGEVFDSKALINIYAEGAPLSLSELRETHEYKNGEWVAINS